MLESSYLQSAEIMEPWEPGAYISKDRKLIVLMHATSAGSVIYSKGSTYAIGEYQEHWLMSEFLPFYGELKLTSTRKGKK